MHIWLRAGEKVYINGAVIRADRKVTIELMNDATFLLAAHVLQAEDATTPLKQLYFIVQTMLIDPAGAAEARRLFAEALPRTLASFANPKIVQGLLAISTLVHEERTFEALKTIRGLFSIEESILAPACPTPASVAASPVRIVAPVQAA